MVSVMPEGLLTVEESVLEILCEKVRSWAQGYCEKGILNFERKSINFNWSTGVKKFALRTKFMSRVA